jgi:glycosyltransferase involved in cell wall biosynthesis
MRIVQIVEKLDIGGLEKIAIDLSNNLSKEHEVLIISLQSFDKDKIKKWIEINDNIIVVSLFKDKDKSNYLNILKMIIKMRNLILKFKPDVIHSHHIGPLLYSILSTIGIKLKIVHTEHDIWYLNNKKNLFIRKILGLIKNHKTIALTNNMEKVLNNKFNIRNTDTVFNGINLECLTYVSDAKQKLNIDEDFVIGCCGRIEKVKNHKYLIEQAKKHKNIRFLIAGGGSLLEEFKKESPSNVTFLGHQNNLSLFFSAIDVFCLPSENEGLPLSILEAYYYNLPVYSTNVGSINEIICDQKYFIKTNEDLNIFKIKENKKINMKENIENQFSLLSMTNNYLSKYED